MVSIEAEGIVKDQLTREVEAESVAYVVCNHFGLDTSEYSFSYIASWSSGKNSMPDVDNLLTSFYQLDDEARKEVVETIQFKLQYHRDPERAEQVKQIKGW